METVRLSFIKKQINVKHIIHRSSLRIAVFFFHYFIPLILQQETTTPKYAKFQLSSYTIITIGCSIN